MQACERTRLLGRRRRALQGQAITDTDRVFAELAHKRLCLSRLTAVSRPLDALRQALAKNTLEVSLYVATKIVAKCSLKLHHTDQPARIPRARRRRPTAAKQQPQWQPPQLEPTQAPTPYMRPRNDSVARRRELGSPTTPYMRHCVRRRRRKWEQIGAIGQIVNWIRHWMWIKFKHGLRPPAFNHGVSMLDATHAQLSFLPTEYPVSKHAEPGNVDTTHVSCPACF
jgi:hypothetical protein